jgi:hypothetical protein
MIFEHMRCCADRVLFCVMIDIFTRACWLAAFP